LFSRNVGGPIWQAVLPLLNRFARVPMCGVIAHYNGAAGAEQDLLPATMLAIVRRSLVLRGYINVEFVDEHYDTFLREIGPKVRSGDIRYREDIVDGLEKAPEAFIGMLAGRNFGKALVRLS
jgi:NADPH-dependent curcumin reductase